MEFCDNVQTGMKLNSESPEKKGFSSLESVTEQCFCVKENFLISKSQNYGKSFLILLS